MVYKIVFKGTLAAGLRLMNTTNPIFLSSGKAWFLKILEASAQNMQSEWSFVSVPSIIKQVERALARYACKWNIYSTLEWNGSMWSTLLNGSDQYNKDLYSKDIVLLSIKISTIFLKHYSLIKKKNIRHSNFVHPMSYKLCTIIKINSSFTGPFGIRLFC